jgi:hypothetical protein
MGFSADDSNAIAMRLVNKPLELWFGEATAPPTLWHPQDRVADLLERAENEAAARHHLIHGVDQIFLKRSPFATYMYKGENSDPLSSNVAHGMDFTIESLAARYDGVGDACMNLAAPYLEIAEAIAQLGKEINPPSAP